MTYATLFPAHVKLVEVGPRDGLQNERNSIPTHQKIELINRLSETGLTAIEATSFVSSKWVPQMEDALEVFTSIERKSQITYPVLVPNLNGLERAVSAGVTEIAIFGSASEAFSQKNINCTITESLERFQSVCLRALQKNIKIRGYISCTLGCPYQGAVSAHAVANIARQMIDLGCYEISLGDTIGAGTPLQAKKMIHAVLDEVPMEQLAIHFHDTRGQALANIYACLELGISVIDSSIAGLGGCPYAKGASGNVATEDLLYMLHGMNIDTGVNLAKVIEVGHFVQNGLGCQNRSKVGQAGITQ
ncbi:MAG: hydroxymethylglutaryl-CoA lyase [SAR324 cluster bacterium]|nr:hydroxymethylglutaryl-CoA lyase [SAR324 cluster bacterium]